MQLAETKRDFWDRVGEGVGGGRRRRRIRKDGHKSRQLRWLRTTLKSNDVKTCDESDHFSHFWFWRSQWTMNSSQTEGQTHTKTQAGRSESHILDNAGTSHELEHNSVLTLKYSTPLLMPTVYLPDCRVCNPILLQLPQILYSDPSLGCLSGSGNMTFTWNFHHHNCWAQIMYHTSSVLDSRNIKQETIK